MSSWVHCAEEFTSIQNNILAAASLTSCILSINGSCLLISHFLRTAGQSSSISASSSLSSPHRKKRTYIFERFIFFLSVADLFSSLAIAISRYHSIVFTTRSKFLLCYIFRSAIDYFWISSWLWTVAIAVYLFRTITLKNDLFLAETLSSNRRNKDYSPLILLILANLTCWTLPLIQVFIFIKYDLFQISSRQQYCMLQEPYDIYGWEIPNVVTFCINFTIFTVIIVLLNYRQCRASAAQSSGQFSAGASRSHHNLNLLINVQKKLLSFLIVFLICWGFDIFQHFGTFLHVLPRSCAYFWLSLFQSFFASLQGFLNCIVYGLSNNTIKREYSFQKLILFYIFSPVIVFYAAGIYIREKIRAARERSKESQKGLMRGSGGEGNSFYNALIADVADDASSSGETEIVFGLSKKNLLASDTFYEEGYT